MLIHSPEPRSTEHERIVVASPRSPAFFIVIICMVATVYFAISIPWLASVAILAAVCGFVQCLRLAARKYYITSQHLVTRDWWTPSQIPWSAIEYIRLKAIRRRIGIEVWRMRLSTADRHITLDFSPDRVEYYHRKLAMLSRNATVIDYENETIKRPRSNQAEILPIAWWRLCGLILCVFTWDWLLGIAWQQAFSALISNPAANWLKAGVYVAVVPVMIVLSIVYVVRRTLRFMRQK